MFTFFVGCYPCAGWERTPAYRGFARLLHLLDGDDALLSISIDCWRKSRPPEVGLEPPILISASSVNANCNGWRLRGSGTALRHGDATRQLFRTTIGNEICCMVRTGISASRRPWITASTRSSRRRLPLLRFDPTSYDGMPRGVHCPEMEVRGCRDESKPGSRSGRRDRRHDHQLAVRRKPVTRVVLLGANDIIARSVEDDVGTNLWSTRPASNITAVPVRAGSSCSSVISGFTALAAIIAGRAVGAVTLSVGQSAVP